MRRWPRPAAPRSMRRCSSSSCSGVRMDSAQRYWPSSSATGSPSTATSNSASAAPSSVTVFMNAVVGTVSHGTSNSPRSSGVRSPTRSRCSTCRTREPISGSSLLRVGPYVIRPSAYTVSGASGNSCATACAGFTWMDSRASCIRSSPRSHNALNCRSHSGTSSGRGDQPPGWKGAIVSFQESTPSKRPRSRSKPGIVSSWVDVSGTAALLLTSSKRRSAAGKQPLSSAAASVASPYSVDAAKICVVRIRRQPPPRSGRGGGAAGAAGRHGGSPSSPARP